MKNFPCWSRNQPVAPDCKRTRDQNWATWPPWIQVMRQCRSMLPRSLAKNLSKVINFHTVILLVKSDTRDWHKRYSWFHKLWNFNNTISTLLPGHSWQHTMSVAIWSELVFAKVCLFNKILDVHLLRKVWYNYIQSNKKKDFSYLSQFQPKVSN